MEKMRIDFTLLLLDSSHRVDPCTQDQEAGVGSVQLTRFYFNKQTKLCEEFVYFGAGGNRNNFLTLEECQAQCPGSALHSRALFGSLVWWRSVGGCGESAMEPLGYRHHFYRRLFSQAVFL
ncbi:Kunitz/Bovine pancreatic trypsin inhibitor domain protein [Ancylostoma duodenale]|uniref:Kunitz/Bovine pancreatic trypsin inhibitor domain protein n=1 Tax=Ancylostoma duodenale TaxID=51022 RepID=A0A0C2GVD5_9BILA|nr:Kunitz/Bovine pancreatic trypsin inhibitor domain protein [Ancylostoma duodenale]